MVTQPTFVYDEATARQRYNAREVRLLRDEQDKQQAYREKRRLAALTEDQQQDMLAKQDYILQALARTQAKKTDE